jgi:tetratricopeptide (TPR) repeat protein
MNEKFEAARILFRHGSRTEAKGLLRHLWEATDRRADQEFRLFGALIEIWTFENPRTSMFFLESVIRGEGDLQAFWARRSISEQAAVLEWHGQLAYSNADSFSALESLTRAASLGRDNGLLWRLLSSLHASNGELDMALRFAKRSLQLYRQPELDLLGGPGDEMGAFSGEHPLRFESGLEAYMRILLVVTKLARGQKNLKGVRELVLEMLHHFPDDPRLPKIRLMLEKSIVESSLQLGDSALPRLRLKSESP